MDLQAQTEISNATWNGESLNSKSRGPPNDSLLELASLIHSGSTCNFFSTDIETVFGSEDSLLSLADDVLADFEPFSLGDDLFNDIEPNQVVTGQSRYSLLEATLNHVLSDTSHFVPQLPYTRQFSTRVVPVVTLPPESQQQSSVSSQPNQATAVPRTVEQQPKQATPMARTLEQNQVVAPPGSQFRDYQTAGWSTKFKELQAYKEKNGHCCVPYTFRENPSLAHCSFGIIILFGHFSLANVFVVFVG